MFVVTAFFSFKTFDFNATRAFRGFVFTRETSKRNTDTHTRTKSRERRKPSVGRNSASVGCSESRVVSVSVSGDRVGFSGRPSDNRTGRKRTFLEEYLFKDARPIGIYWRRAGATSLASSAHLAAVDRPDSDCFDGQVASRTLASSAHLTTDCHLRILRITSIVSATLFEPTRLRSTKVTITEKIFLKACVFKYLKKKSIESELVFRRTFVLFTGNARRCRSIRVDVVSRILPGRSRAFSAVCGYAEINFRKRRDERSPSHNLANCCVTQYSFRGGNCGPRSRVVSAPDENGGRRLRKNARRLRIGIIRPVFDDTHVSTTRRMYVWYFFRLIVVLELYARAYD